MEGGALQIVATHSARSDSLGSVPAALRAGRIARVLACRHHGRLSATLAGHSTLNTSAGSDLPACLAGRTLASIPTASSTRAAAENTNGSRASTW